MTIWVINLWVKWHFEIFKLSFYERINSTAFIYAPREQNTHILSAVPDCMYCTIAICPFYPLIKRVLRRKLGQYENNYNIRKK